MLTKLRIEALIISESQAQMAVFLGGVFLGDGLGIENLTDQGGLLQAALISIEQNHSKDVTGSEWIQLRTTGCCRVRIKLASSELGMTRCRRYFCIDNVTVIIIQSYEAL